MAGSRAIYRPSFGARLTGHKWPYYKRAHSRARQGAGIATCINLMPSDPQFPPWLVVFDVDGVLLRSHFLIAMSRRAGLVAWGRAWVLSFLFNAGWLPFNRLVQLVYSRFAGQTTDDARAVFERMRLRPGAEETIAALKQDGHKVVAVSSGVPAVLLDALADRLGLDACVGIECGHNDQGALDGSVSGELVEPGGKVAAVARLHERFGTDWAHTIVAADDRNNLELMARAAATVGVRPNWPVRRVATYIADSGDMAEVLNFVQGHVAGHHPEPEGHEPFRKLLHVLGAAVPFAAKLSLAGTTIGLAAAAAVYALSEAWRLNGMALPGVTWITRHAVRREELRRPSLGPVFLVAACLICLHGFEWPIAAAAILLVTLGDTAAALVGRRWGQHRLPYSRGKSLEGTAAFVFTGVAATIWLLPWPACLAACAAAAAVESLPLKDADNLLAPLAAAFVAAAL